MGFSCCCKSKNGDSDDATGHSRAPPSKQSMNRDSMNDDERAVDWWRNRQKSYDEEDENSNSNRNRQPGLPSRERSLENSKKRLQDRNPLEKPYKIKHDYTTKKSYNSNLNQSIDTTDQDVDEHENPLTMMLHSQDSIEVFEPQHLSAVAGGDDGDVGNHATPMSTNNASLDDSGIHPLKHASQKMRLEERVKLFAPADGSTRKAKSTPPPSPPIIPKMDASGNYHKTPSKMAADDTKYKNYNRSSSPSSSPPSTSKRNYDMNGNNHNDKDQKQQILIDETGSTSHLSDLPSDVDSVTRDRYLLACNMLKTTVLEKDKVMVPIEREFILSLLGDYEKNAESIDGITTASSVISEDQVSAIEKAQLRLDKDPLFRSSNGSFPFDELSPEKAASIQMQEYINSDGNKPNKTTDLHSMPRGMDVVTNNDSTDPNQATSSKKRGPPSVKMPMKKMLIDASSYASSYGACNHPRLSKKGKNRGADTAPADLVLLVRDSEDDDENFEDDNEELVRFDGWSNHRSDDYPFRILDAADPNIRPRVLTPSIMEALQGFFPYQAAESNFWLKFSMNRDGASLAKLLDTIRASTHTIIAVETMHGEIFGSFTSTPWRAGTKWFGTGEAFLWRLKKSRMTSPKNSKLDNFENEMEVYPYTGYDDLVQYCTSKTIAIGGGDWTRENFVSPFDDEPKGIGLMIDGDLAGGETNSCATFANPRLCKKTTASNEFSISNLEVWTLTPCLDSKEASKLEVKKLFVEENQYYEL